jgi:putative chitobiose transport system permease protein
VNRIGRFGLGAVVAALFVLPLWWTVAGALRPQEETFATISPLSGWTLVPRHPTLDNFAHVFDTGFGRAMLNSTIVTVGTVVGGLAICAAAAFALPVLRFPVAGVPVAVADRAEPGDAGGPGGHSGYPVRSGRVAGVVRA